MRLAEALGIETEANWDAVAKRRNIARYGTMDRRNKQGPMPYFNASGTGAAQDGQRPAMRGQGKPPPPIPNGTDRPGQTNPLFGPPSKGSMLPQATGGSVPGGMNVGSAQDAGAPDDETEADGDWLDSLSGNGRR
jgi:hypothetical protein